MFNNKKKFVSGVFAAATLTGAFIAPTSAQAADSNPPKSIQQTIKEASDAEKVAKQAPQKVDAAKKTLESVKKDAQKAINAATTLKNDAQTKAGQAEENLKQAKQDLETKIITAAKKTETADKSQNKNDIKQANNAKKDAENARINFEIKQSDFTQRQETLKVRVENLATVTKEENSKIEAADTVYTQAQVEQQQAIQKASVTKEAADKAWGNWTKKTTIEDHLTDKSGFQTLIPEFQKLVQKERLEIAAQDVAAQKLDPSTLFLKHNHNVRVWFINEGAGYRNQLAYEATKGNDYQKGMIFDDVSCKSGCQLSNGANAPLDIGDFVNLGLIKGGTQLNFLLKADGANANPANGDIYGGDTSLNSDGLQHLMAFAVKAGGRDYLLMGFEDLRNGGDKDYNDAVFVVDFGKGNLTNKFVQAQAVPEASNVAAILGVTGAGLMLRRRRRNLINN